MLFSIQLIPGIYHILIGLCILVGVASIIALTKLEVKREKIITKTVRYEKYVILEDGTIVYPESN
jgi:hypothetical protein